MWALSLPRYCFVLFAVLELAQLILDYSKIIIVLETHTTYESAWIQLV